MKHLFLGIALLLAAAAAAQTQPRETRPVMRMGDPDLYLELELRPGYGSAYNTLGYNYMALQDMDKAKAAFEKYLELAPAEANAYDSMGDYYMAAEDYAKAAEYFGRAVALGMESSKQKVEKARAAMGQKDN